MTCKLVAGARLSQNGAPRSGLAAGTKLQMQHQMQCQTASSVSLQRPPLCSLSPIKTILLCCINLRAAAIGTRLPQHASFSHTNMCAILALHAATCRLKKQRSCARTHQAPSIKSSVPQVSVTCLYGISPLSHSSIKGTITKSASTCRLGVRL